MKSLRFVHASILLVVLTCLCVPLPVQAAPEPQDVPLFTDATPPGDLAAAAVDDPAATRTRFVNVNLSALDPYLYATDLSAQAETPLSIELFPDTQISVVFSERTGTVTGGISLSGKVVGDQDGIVTLSIQNEIITATIWVGSACYGVHYLQDNIYAINQIDTTQLPPDGPEMVPAESTGEIPDADITSQYGGDDIGGQIDVMVLYTSNASIANGGTDNIVAQINNGINNANYAYDYSDINQTMALVHIQEINYDDTRKSWEQIIDDLTDPRDGDIDYIHGLRDTYAADLVVLVINREEYCGLGWMLDNSNDTSFDEYAFSIVSNYWGCVGMNTIAHETGHNMGANHDRANASGKVPYPYAYGYQSIDSYGYCDFYTIMAYPYGCYGGSQIPYFSNPGVSYNYIRTGIDSSFPNSADNHQVLNNTSALVARFRDGAPAKPPQNLTTRMTTNSTTLNWAYSYPYTEVNLINGFIVQRLQGGSWVEIGRTYPHIFTFDDNNVTCGMVYTYRVLAYGPNGITSPSNEASRLACALYRPTSLTATASSYNPAKPNERTVNLAWQDTNSNDANYQIERRVLGGISFSYVYEVNRLGATTYADSTVSCGTTYEYRVFAIAYPIKSGFSDIATVTSLICAPLQPTGLSATKHSQIRINLFWTDPSNSASNNEEYFRIERQTGTGAWEFLTNAGSGVTSYSDASLACGTTYSYRIRSSNAGGDSAWSSTVTDTTYACNTAPQSPDTVMVQPAAINAVQITWENVDVETGYHLERSPNGVDSWTEIAAPGADAASYMDTFLPWDTTYYYRVRAENANGLSGYSATANGKAHKYGVFFP